MIDELLDQLMAVLFVLVFVALIGFAGWVTSADEKAAEYIGAIAR
jgi:hypothetical protein